MKAKVTRSGARIHKKNSNLSQVVGSLEIGDEIEIEAEYGRWVKLVEGGWLKAVYTEPTDLSGAGGGGGAQADWSVNDEGDPSFVKNRTHYESVVKSHVFQQEAVEIASAKGSATLSASPEAASGSVIVNFDGVEYSIIGYQPEDSWGPIDDWGEYRCYGNGSLIGATNMPMYNGYPFMVALDDAGAGRNAVVFASTAGPHTVEMYSASSSVKTLDPKYLPEEVAMKSDIPEGFSGSWNDLKDKPFYETEKVHILKQATLTSTYADLDREAVGYPPAEECTVAFDGEKCAGSVDIFWDETTFTDRVEISFTTSSGTKYTLTNSYEFTEDFDDGSHSVEVYLGGEIETLDPEYLPAAAAVADAAGDNPTAAEFNALLASLRAAGYLAE